MRYLHAGFERELLSRSPARRVSRRLRITR